MSPKSLTQRVSRQEMLRLLDVHGEGDDWDFKLTCDLHDPQSRVELVKDLFALANSPDGGHLVLGVTPRTYQPVGLAANVRVDTTEIYQSVSKYNSDFQLAAAEYQIQRPGWPASRRFGIVFVAPYTGIALLPSTQGAYQDASGKQVVAFRTDEILTRRGAQSCRADQATINRLLRRAQLATSSGADIPRAPLSDLDTLPLREEIAAEFVGRSRELLLLWEWFNDRDRSRRVLAGDGGKGKTAIAYEFACQVRLAAPQPYDCILWFSAKQRRFVEGLVVDIETPDFSDLKTLLQAIVMAYGFPEYAELPVREIRSKARELLTKLPALIIADDIDSLEGRAEEAYGFLYDLGGTGSRVLLTSRDQPRGLSDITTPIDGLDPEDAVAFTRHRIEAYRLDPAIFKDPIIAEILEATDRSPLYLDELLRLSKFMPIRDAIAEWKSRGGDAARVYALRKEFERLTNDAKLIVLGACVSPGAISLPELEALTDIPRDKIVAELNDIQNLFLMSQPRLIEEVERFDVNLNTRYLVQKVFEGSDLMARILDRRRRMSDEAKASHLPALAPYIRQAISLGRLNQFDEAEKTLQAARQQWPSNADLLGELGVLYAVWKPLRRTTEARDCFRRALELKCRRVHVYRQWAQMELAENEWSEAGTVAERALDLAGPSATLYYTAGYAHSRRGQDLKRRLESERSSNELEVADALLRTALKERSGGPADATLRPKIYRALVLNSIPRHYFRDMDAYLEQWCSEFPEDQTAQTEAKRLRATFASDLGRGR